MKGISRYMVWAASTLMAGACLLPLYSRDGLAVHGFSCDLGVWAGFPALGLAAAAAVLAALPRKWAAKLLPWAATAAMVLAVAVIWKGWKLGAVGAGAWLLLLGALLAIPGALLHVRQFR